ncbi:hypothetical protein D9V34_14255 [Mycetocola lacteus]|uniref:Sce7726 family protein n=1 Tax=Mycetocola lacteus TaxID=76637 RepID=A0A3L7AJM5_9MICO|nr:sce7726 family protein [Mycetocola lacteus]RLP80224.1 hypothetical protein D9V34_14255 [Mycetocola lacteus]
MSSTSTGELTALSRIFSASAIREIGSRGYSPALARALSETAIPERLPAHATLAEAYTMAFHTLQKIGNRDDYVYRSALTQKILLGRHNLRTATVLNEFRAGRSKADLVVLNGTSTAYEIKSERDSFQRLHTQLSDYRSVFGSVYVITSPTQVKAALRLTSEDVGVLTLSDRFRIQTVRPALDQPERTSALSILETLRFDEALKVLDGLGIDFPEVPNTRRWGALRHIFAALDPATVHAHTVAVLRESRSQAHLEFSIRELPRPLTAAILATNPSASARHNIRLATRQPVSEVLTWK